MQLSDVYRDLGQERFQQILRQVSIGQLKRYQLYEPLKIRLHLAKLNTETLRKAAPRLWNRLGEGDQDLAQDLAQAVLIPHLDMVKAVLDFLGIPHEEGFFAKDLDPSQHLTENWRGRAYEQFKDTFPDALLLFYLNHLSYELDREAGVFVPTAA